IIGNFHGRVVQAQHRILERVRNIEVRQGRTNRAKQDAFWITPRNYEAADENMILCLDEGARRTVGEGRGTSDSECFVDVCRLKGRLRCAARKINCPANYRTPDSMAWGWHAWQASPAVATWVVSLNFTVHPVRSLTTEHVKLTIDDAGSDAGAPCWHVGQR